MDTSRLSLNILIHTTMLFTILACLYIFVVKKVEEDSLNVELQQMIQELITSSPSITKNVLNNELDRMENNIFTNAKIQDITTFLKQKPLINTLGNLFSDIRQYNIFINNIIRYKISRIETQRLLENLQSVEYTNNVVESEISYDVMIIYSLKNYSDLYNQSTINGESLTRIKNEIKKELFMIPSGLLSSLYHGNRTQFSNILNKFVENELLNELIVQQIKPELRKLPFDALEKLYSTPDQLQVCRNNYTTSTMLYTIVFLVTVCIIIYFMAHYTDLRELVFILKENIAIFAVVGIIEYYFFTEIALKYVPITNSEMKAFFFNQLKNY
jgi:hypothetical protein